jgi:hypothetical protein
MWGRDTEQELAQFLMELGVEVAGGRLLARSFSSPPT